MTMARSSVFGAFSLPQTFGGQLPLGPLVNSLCIDQLIICFMASAIPERCGGCLILRTTLSSSISSTSGAPSPHPLDMPTSIRYTRSSHAGLMPAS